MLAILVALHIYFCSFQKGHAKRRKGRLYIPRSLANQIPTQVSGSPISIITLSITKHQLQVLRNSILTSTCLQKFRKHLPCKFNIPENLTRPNSSTIIPTTIPITSRINLKRILILVTFYLYVAYHIQFNYVFSSQYQRSHIHY